LKLAINSASIILNKIMQNFDLSLISYDPISKLPSRTYGRTISKKKHMEGKKCYRYFIESREEKSKQTSGMKKES
jgi:hypothetical protein